ncbi:aldehyde dehydrogenase family protein [Rhodococcus sp. WS4]|nr:aldehyde dehydrogenase family protein [Rhodococcus sp. WS4]
MHSLTPEYRDLFIGGRWVATSSNECIELVSHHTGSAPTDFLLPSVLDIDDTVDIAHLACHGEQWTSMTSSERLALAGRLLDTFDRQRDRWARYTVAENAAPGPFSKDMDAPLPGRREDGTEAAAPTTPLGVVVIVPWTGASAVALVTEVANTLADGGAVIVNLTADSVRTGRLIGELVVEAGVPEGVVSVLTATAPVSKYLVTHPDVDRLAVVGAETSRQTTVAA